MPLLNVGRLARNARDTLAGMLGLRAPVRLQQSARLRITIIGGYGYANTGDEAQLGANLDHWRRLAPDADITVLSPDPDYTERQHGCRSEYASRVVFFRSSSNSNYGLSNLPFRLAFWIIGLRMLVNAHFIRAGFGPPLATSSEASLLIRLLSTDVLHVSGGGFLTGSTKSRLWDSCLIMRLCLHLGTPYFLTGQTIGLFETHADRWLARKALSGALYISLRDPWQSRIDLEAIGVPADRLVSSFDDALFCAKSTPDDVRDVLRHSGLDPNREYIAVNYHWWGMDGPTQVATARRLAEVMDQVVTEWQVQILFVPMVEVDEAPERGVIQEMTQSARWLEYDYDYRIVRGVIAHARCLVSFKHHPLIFALGEGVPALSISLDKYYERKNEGAMRNFEQQHFCVHGESFFREEFTQRLAEVMSKGEQIRGDILSRHDALAERGAGLHRRVHAMLNIATSESRKID